MSKGSAWPMPPHVQMHDFLPRDEQQGLLDWALDHEVLFRPAKIIHNEPTPRNITDAQFRIALVTREIGPMAPLIEQRLRDALPALEKATGCSGGARSIELELAAHGDGAHYNAHTDIPLGANRKPVGARPNEDRVLSAVYYFYGIPKAFSGGELRLFRLNVRPSSFSANPGDFVDIVPILNSLVAFPSWTTHAVRPVACPSKRFQDYRFALNCWFCRQLS